MANASRDNSEQSQDYRQYQVKLGPVLKSFELFAQKNLQPTEEQWQQILRAGGINAVLRKKQELDEEWRKVKVLIAVIGKTGSGKSTLIRRLLFILPDDENGPEIGAGVEHCTLEAKEYPKPNTGLIYVDLPGVGATADTFAFNTPADQDRYCERFDLKSIDYFLLVSDGKMNDQEKFLIQYITKTLKKNFSFIQTKMDLLRKERGTKLLEKEIGLEGVKNKIRNDIQKNLAIQDSRRIFFISNDAVDVKCDEKQSTIYDDSPDYEFDLLKKQIDDDMQDEDGLPTQKGEAFILATGAISKSSIRALANALRNQTRNAAITSAAVGASPVPGVSLVCDAVIVISFATRYFMTFGLDPTGVLGEGSPMRKVINLVQAMIANMGVRVTALLSIAVALDAAEEGLKLIPVVGTAVGATLGAGISYFTTSTILNHVIDFCEMKALERMDRSAIQD